MPAQKRSLQENHAIDDQQQEEQDSFLQNHAKHSRHERLELQDNEQLEEEQLEQKDGREEDQKPEEIEAQGGGGEEKDEDGDGNVTFFSPFCLHVYVNAYTRGTSMIQRLIEAIAFFLQILRKPHLPLRKKNPSTYNFSLLFVKDY